MAPSSARARSIGTPGYRRAIAPVWTFALALAAWLAWTRLPLTLFDRGMLLSQDNLSRAIQLARVKGELRQRWGGIKVVGMHTSGNGHYKVGDQMQVEAMVDLPEVDPKDVSIQLYAGPINAGGNMENPQVQKMAHTRQMGPGRVEVAPLHRLLGLAKVVVSPKLSPNQVRGLPKDRQPRQ